MKRFLLWVLSFTTFAILAVTAYPACLPQRTYHTLLDTWCQEGTLKIEKRERNYIDWPDGGKDYVDTVGYGGCNSQLKACYPEFMTPEISEGHWEQVIADRVIMPLGNCDYPNPQSNRFYEVNHTCRVSSSNNCTTPGWDGSCPPGTSPDGFGMCCGSGSTCSATEAFINRCYGFVGQGSLLT